MQRLIFSASNYDETAVSRFTKMEKARPDLHWNWCGNGQDTTAYDAFVDDMFVLSPDLQALGVHVFSNYPKVLSKLAFDYRVQSSRDYLARIGHPDLIEKYPICIDWSWLNKNDVAKAWLFSTKGTSLFNPRLTPV